MMTSNDNNSEDNFYDNSDNDDPTIRPEQGVPKSGEGFIDFIGQVEEIFDQNAKIIFRYSSFIFVTNLLLYL